MLSWVEHKHFFINSGPGKPPMLEHSQNAKRNGYIFLQCFGRDTAGFPVDWTQRKPKSFLTDVHPLQVYPFALKGVKVVSERLPGTWPSSEFPHRTKSRSVPLPTRVAGVLQTCSLMPSALKKYSEIPLLRPPKIKTFYLFKTLFAKFKLFFSYITSETIISFITSYYI